MIGYDKTAQWKKALLNLPGMISILLITVGIGELHARIMAIADVFDAVSQKRCYRDAMTLEDSFSIIEKGIGTDFDPHLAWIFLDNKDEVIKLMKQFQE